MHDRERAGDTRAWLGHHAAECLGLTGDRAREQPGASAAGDQGQERLALGSLDGEVGGHAARLQRLVEQGNTVVVIEHNLDVIKSADWLIDLGPEGGSGGGTLVAEGPPEHVATIPASHTGRFLAPLVNPAPAGAPRRATRRKKTELAASR